CANFACPGQRPGTFHYDLYQFTNPTFSSVCVTVILENSGCGASGGIYSAAYYGNVDPSDACINYIAGGMRSPGQYIFLAPPGPFAVVVEEYTANAGCADYTVTLLGLPCPPPPPPTVTPCPLQFADVPPGSPFYAYVRCLTCRGILSGYSNSPPCLAGQAPC